MALEPAAGEGDKPILRAVGDGGRRTERAIDVLRDYSAKSEGNEPAITSTSTGVMINTARDLVRKAS